MYAISLCSSIAYLNLAKGVHSLKNTREKKIEIMRFISPKEHFIKHDS